MFGGLTGAGGQIASASMQAGAIKDATEMQLNALKQQREYVYKNLDPATIAPQVTSADIARAENQLRLQGQIDPALLKARYAGEAAQAEQLGQFGPGSPAGQVAGEATSEALAGTPGITEAKNKLAAQANELLNQGATLPPDVQAELVKAGLEQSGMVTGAASPQGVGGTLLRTLIGREGLALKMQRQQQASTLVAAAQNLETSRQNILQSLFPNLTNQQLSNLKAQQSAIGLSEQLTPTVGPTGTDIANLWLARVGATNQLAQSAATISGQNAMALGNVWGNAVGGATRAAGGSLPYLQNLFSGTSSSGADSGIQSPTDWSNFNY